MFVVIDSERQAIGSNFGISEEAEWNNASFKTFTEAVDYAKKWLGAYGSVLPDNWDGSEIDYSGYGDKISIRREE